MTDDTAQKIANATLALAAAGVAFVVLKNPPLRRMAWRLAIAGLTGTLPAWLNQEVRRAWAESVPQSAGSRAGSPDYAVERDSM